MPRSYGCRRAPASGAAVISGSVARGVLAAGRLRPLAEAGGTELGYFRRMRVDALLAAAVAVLGQAEVWTGDPHGAPRALLAAAALVASDALAWRRRAPVASAAVAVGT